MSKHTPGPWKYGVRRDNSIWLSIGDPAKGPHRQGDLYASEADARLIAAAPELLEALKETLPFMVDIAKARHHKFELHMADDDSTIGKAMRAIAKAEGRS